MQAFFFLEPAARWLTPSRDGTTDPTLEAFYGLVLAEDVEIHDLQGALVGLSADRSMTVEETGTHFSDAAAQVLAEAMAVAIEVGLPLQ